MIKQNRRGFTLVELAAVIGAGSLIAAQVMPMAKRARNTNRGMSSAGNLMQIGQGAGMYGVDNADRIPAYTAPGRINGAPYDFNIGGGDTYRVRDSISAIAAEQAEILRRRTGRFDGDFEIQVSSSRLWNRRWTNLVIMDYLNRPFPDPLFIDPADANQLTWASDPLDFDAGSTVPYANGIPAGYDSDGNWVSDQVRNRWAFASSYQTTASAWQPDGLDGPSYHPVADTPHLFGNNGSGLGPDIPFGREFGEVRFPSAKVYQFEEFDREQAGNPYFAYDQARSEKLMFDGSVNNWASGDASPSFNVDQPGANGKAEWRQTYVPIDTFPVPLGGLGDDTLLSQRYRWTLGGLQGVDYPMPIMGSNVRRR